MAKGSGNLIFLKWDSNAVVGLTDKSISFDTDMIDVTDQQSTGGWKQYIPGEKGSKINFSGVYDESATEGATTMWADLYNGTKVTFKIGENGAGLTYWTGSGYVSNISLNGPKNDASSYSGSIQVTGPVTAASAGF